MHRACCGRDVTVFLGSGNRDGVMIVRPVRQVCILASRAFVARACTSTVPSPPRPFWPALATAAPAAQTSHP